jgi:hypothetical protein
VLWNSGACHSDRLKTFLGVTFATVLLTETSFIGEVHANDVRRDLFRAIFGEIHKNFVDTGHV